MIYAYRPIEFQCSSASRKFLNFDATGSFIGMEAGFSALQRAENSSIVHQSPVACQPPAVSVLFSEPKIPQSERAASLPARATVSVLFSEPKIPQFNVLADYAARVPEVSVLFSEPKIPQSTTPTATRCSRPRFQCSSASRKFLNRTLQALRDDAIRGFSALQRAENSSMIVRSVGVECRETFQCSSASRKFLNVGDVVRFSAGRCQFQCSSASRKFLN